jgi:simple sugar transport system ATP-binding protein
MDVSLNEERRAPGAEPEGPPALVRMHGIVKEFPGVRANDGVDFDVRAGEVHALLGENGAGKSTLMHLLAGLLRPTAGSIEIHGEPVALTSPRIAIEHRVGMVHQHFRLVERFTVAENVTLGWHTPKRLIKPRELEREIGELSAIYGMPVAPERPVWQLSVGEQQRVEILKNLYRGARILILDEPTAVLTPQEAQGLFDSMRQMASDGRGLIFISHKLDEVMAVADRVTVLNRGRNVATVRAAETSAAQLARLMIGRDLPSRSRPRREPGGESVLRLEDVSASDARGLPGLRGVDLEVRAGEIVGVAGVAGNGQRELAETIVGLRPATSGRVLLRGTDVTRWKVPRRARAGIGYSPEDRKREGLAASLSLLDNLCARRLARRGSGYARRGTGS